VKKIIFPLLLLTSLYAQQTTNTKLQDVIALGEDIVNHTDTNPLSKKYVDSKLQCVNCHRKGKDNKAGTTNKIGTFIGTATAFPAYSKRHHDIITLQNRIDGCFLRCLGGRSVVNTKVGIAVASYITSLSKGMKIQMSPKAPRTPLKQKMWSEGRKKFIKLFHKATHQDYLEGKKLYAQKCAACHGNNGAGNASTPPLWGKNNKGEWLSYTADGSMAKLPNAAVWIQDNMPLGNANTLSDTEVRDIVLYINSKPRKSYKGFKVEQNFKQMGLDFKTITQ